MRKASVTIVPLFFAISLLFWFIWFFGAQGDNLHTINKVGHLQDIQASLLLATIKKRYELEMITPKMSQDDLNTTINEYVNYIMRENKIQKMEITDD